MLPVLGYPSLSVSYMEFQSYGLRLPLLQLPHSYAYTSFISFLPYHCKLSQTRAPYSSCYHANQHYFYIKSKYFLRIFPLSDFLFLFYLNHKKQMSIRKGMVALKLFIHGIFFFLSEQVVILKKCLSHYADCHRSFDNKNQKASCTACQHQCHSCSMQDIQN